MQIKRIAHATYVHWLISWCLIDSARHLPFSCAADMAADDRSWTVRFFCNSSFVIVEYTQAGPGFPVEGDANLEIKESFDLYWKNRPGTASGVCSFCRNFAKLCNASGFWENVLDSFSFFYIEIAVPTLLSVAPTHSIIWRVTQFQQNEHTPGTDPWFPLEENTNLETFLSVLRDQLRDGP